MARKPAPGSRDRILGTAARLFQEHGTRAVGTQQIIDECGCGKKLLYQEFASKDELVVAYLERCQQDWVAIMEAATRPYADDPADQLVAMVRAVAEQVAAPDFRGCPFRTTYAQFPDDDHPSHEVTVRHVRNLRTALHRLAKRAGARDPRTLADRLVLLIDGLYTDGAMLGPRGPATAAVPLAEDLVAMAIRPPARAAPARGSRSRGPASR